ncbi:cytochrome b [Janthinobacterium sp. PC23-8]|uniref:cytochrome b n=1 Tax=Janthinobacterium sp. PC23-8 TaxID=2012679 RepID=UPI000B97A452|nr:cytochrome b [Janthinobacterium sp. PC23-8]OYO27602.1 cytochrome B [Janthinobacterium sp. PC23-8]
MQISNTRTRFGAVAKLFHWSMALAFIGAYVAVYYVIWFVNPETSIKPALFGVVPDAGRVIPLLNIHWILGVTIGVLVLPRLLWRLWSTEPDPLPGPALEHALARWAHRCLYLLMLIMPLTGYITTNHGADFGLFHLTPFKDTALWPALAALTGWSWTAVEDNAYLVHSFIGHWLAWVAVLLHVAAALYHHWVRRDATLSRMLPGTAAKHDAG